MQVTTSPIQINLALDSFAALGAALAEARQVKGWSQQQLAEAAGSTQGVVSGLELGKTDSKSSTIQRHFDALGASTILSISFPSVGISNSSDGGARSWGQK
jgi:transcriptional regulator with XRE-family HTH domain